MISRLRLRSFGFESAAAGYLANTLLPSFYYLRQETSAQGPRQGAAPGAPGPLPGVLAYRRALRCPLAHCGQCAWQQANGNWPNQRGSVPPYAKENVVRRGDGR